MHWPLSLEESKDFCPISNRNFLPVPSKSAGRSCMIKYALTISIGFWFTVSAVSYFSSRSWFGHTEHIKESLQICYTSPRCSRLRAAHSALPQFQEKDGLFYSLSSERHHSIFLLKKNPISLYAVIQTIWLAFIGVWWYMAFFSRWSLNCSRRTGSWHWSAI